MTGGLKTRLRDSDAVVRHGFEPLLFGAPVPEPRSRPSASLESRSTSVPRTGFWDRVCNAPNPNLLPSQYEGLPEKLEAENVDPRIPWLYGFKLDYRFKWQARRYLRHKSNQQTPENRR